MAELDEYRLGGLVEDGGQLSRLRGTEEEISIRILAVDRRLGLTAEIHETMLRDELFGTTQT